MIWKSLFNVVLYDLDLEALHTFYRKALCRLIINYTGPRGENV